MSGKIKLKESVKTGRFGVVFPSDIEMNYYLDDDNRVFAQHPTERSIHICVELNNIVELPESLK